MVGGDIPEPDGAKYFGFRKLAFLKIYNNFSALLSDTSSLGELRGLVNAILDINISLIQLDRIEQAFELYERTNARGVSLEVSDLLKNHLFSRLDAKNHAAFQKQWDQIEANSHGNIFRLLKAFQTSNRGMTPKKKLYRALRDAARGREREFIAEIAQFAEFYSLFRTLSLEDLKNQLGKYEDAKELVSSENKRTKFARNIQALNSFGIVQSIPLIYSMFERGRKLTAVGDPKAKKIYEILLNVTEQLEHFHFLNNAVCNQPGNEVEKLYADFCVEFKNATGIKEFSEVRDSLLRALKEKVVSKDYFIENFCAIRYKTSVSNIVLISYIFDRLNNFQMHNPVRIFNPDESIKSRTFNRDHISPQNPEDEDLDYELDKLHSIGNLIILPAVLNSKLKNLSPPQKFAQLRRHTSELRIIEDLLEDYSLEAENWTDDVIEERSKALAVKCYDKVFPLRG